MFRSCSEYLSGRLLRTHIVHAVIIMCILTVLCIKYVTTIYVIIRRRDLIYFTFLASCMSLFNTQVELAARKMSRNPVKFGRGQAVLK